jgi:hypothetical protein
MADSRTLERGDLLPHFEVETIEGTVFRYSSIWQRKNLLLVLVGAPDAGGAYVCALRERNSAFHALDTVCVVTAGEVPGFPAPAAIVADRWGEIINVSAAMEVSLLPSAEDLLEWMEHVQHRCPECEGESR